ncbi:MAG: hypothetical protein QOG77_134 [Solirubrobacteraceae bacterium]|nr:hypothetical protein [Solirubrobacteraceae bacterium]
MSDRHLRLLRAVAKRRQRDADRQDTPIAAVGSGGRAREVRRVAARAKASLGAAEARRRRPDS